MFKILVYGLRKKRRVRKRKNTLRTQLKHSSKNEYLRYKTEALVIIQARITYFNTMYNFSFNKVTIRNQTSRWGSCSLAKNLNFNYRLAFLPPTLQDYIIVHELCHLQELNHSPKFWALVNITLPEYKALRKTLKNYSLLSLKP